MVQCFFFSFPFVPFLLMSCKLPFGLFHNSSAYTCTAKSLGDYFLMHFLVIYSIFLFSAEISEDLGYVNSVLGSKI